MKKRIFLSIIFGLNSIFVFSQKVEIVSTTVDEAWKAEKVRKLSSGNKLPHAGLIKVDTCVKEQQMIGFGGCFNELGWEALKLLSPDKSNELMNALFHKEGANFYYNRFPIGASDYSSGFYSFNETADDFEMKNFSIARDKNCLVPYIKKAQSINPDMTFTASPWCPPSWMKTNHHYASLSSPQYNNLPQELQSVTGTTGFKMLRGYLDAYSLYFSKFLSAYKEEGINVTDLHVQNEVIAEQIFPSCIWTPEDISLFISDYLGPKLEKEHADVNIWLGTLNVGDPNYVRRALNEKVMKYIKGIGFQWAGKNAISTIHAEYPGISLAQTENECGNGENNWNSAVYTWSLLKTYLNGGAQAYVYWNFILETPGVSYWGWKQNSMVTIDVETHEINYNPEFYLMKHFSHYVQKGAYKLKLNGYEDALAFQNPDGSCIIVMTNPSDEPKDFRIAIDDKNIDLTLKANSFYTIKL